MKTMNDLFPKPKPIDYTQFIEPKKQIYVKYGPAVVCRLVSLDYVESAEELHNKKIVMEQH